MKNSALFVIAMMLAAGAGAAPARLIKCVDAKGVTPDCAADSRLSARYQLNAGSGCRPNPQIG